MKICVMEMWIKQNSPKLIARNKIAKILSMEFTLYFSPPFKNFAVCYHRQKSIKGCKDREFMKYYDAVVSSTSEKVGCWYRLP